MIKCDPTIIRFRISLSLFIVGLIASGVTAFPLLIELQTLVNLFGIDRGTSAFPIPELAAWLVTVRDGLASTYANYPWIAYGTDWLALGHIVIALFFIRPLICPRESRCNLITGLVACLLVLPLALICGPIRGIPFGWRLIDCSFGFFGAIPLFYCLHLLKAIEREGRTD